MTPKKPSNRTTQQLKAAVKRAMTSHLMGKCACGHIYGRHLPWMASQGEYRAREYTPFEYAKPDFPLKCDRCKCKRYDEDNLNWLVNNAKKKKAKRRR